MPTLATQTALRTTKTPGDLAVELGIHVFEHPTLPLTGFTYDQIDSPKTHPIVRECRGLVLERGTWNVVAKPFGRFFNLGEHADEFKLFDWTTCRATSKEDGSLMILYHYAGEWHVNTRGAFGLGIMQNHTKTWREVFWSLLSEGLRAGLNPYLTYVFEMCTIFNKVVRTYGEPTLYLLTTVCNETFSEGDPHLLDTLAHAFGVRRPDHFAFSSEAEVRDFLRQREETDPTFEGVVLKDANGLRFKAKTSTYLSLHAMASDGNLAHPRYLVPWALKEDPGELLTYFPEVKPQFDEVKARLDDTFAKLQTYWRDTLQIGPQKDFALAIKDCPLNSLLFSMRKRHGANQTPDMLRNEFRAAGDAILKRVFDVKP